MEAVKGWFRAEKTEDKGVSITVSKSLVEFASKAAPIAGAILIGNSSPVIFLAAGAGGFILADQLTFANSSIDDVWNKLDLTIQLVAVAGAVVAVFLSPLVAHALAAFAGQRTGAYIRDHYQGWLEAISPPPPKK